MKKIPYVCLYRSYFREMEEYSDEQLGRLMRGLMEYLLTGQEPQLPYPERYYWPRLREQHDRDTEFYDEVCERNRSNGRKGGMTKAARLRLLSLAENNGDFVAGVEKATTNASSLAAGPKEKDIEKETEKEKEYLYKGPKGPNIYTSPPDFSDIEDYCREESMDKVNAREFFDYYTATGWKSGSKPMKDWKAMVRLWQRRAEAEKAASPMEVSYGTVI